MKIPTKAFAIKNLLLLVGLFEMVATASWYTANDGHRYLIEGSQSYNWLQALDQCSRQGLQLAIIDNSSKNKALVALLSSIYGKSIHLWLGHHDEFNTKKDKSRPWYSASTGQSIYFGNWNTGEPNNKVGEHCTEMYGKIDFKWNDEKCDKYSFGYICEEHYQTAECRSKTDAKRETINQKNDQLSKEFVNTQNKINGINQDTRNNTDNLLLQWEKSSADILENLKKSLKELIQKKPYLEVVLADVGQTINALAVETKEAVIKITKETRQLIEDVHVNAENATNSANLEFAKKIETNSKEIDKVMTN